MNGGILKAAGYGAIAALTGVLLSTSSALAADLGGNCCADLEERVAELEATTARKGNRRVSLTVSGQVNTAVMAWDQGVDDAVMIVDNGVSRSGFNFDGSAKINPNLTAGFQMVIGLGTGARSHQTTQLDDDGGAPTDGTLAVELANWYLTHNTLGSLRVGRINSASSGTTLVDLGGAGVIANANAQLWAGNFYITNAALGTAATATVPANAVNANLRVSSMMGGATVGINGLSRQNAISYTTPTVHGFSLQAAWGEQDARDDGMWDVALRYAGEFSGFRVAAAVSYGKNAGNTTDSEDLASTATTLPVFGDGADVRKWQGSASVLHVATGLFLTGAYVNQSYHGVSPSEISVITGLNRPDTEMWYLLGGIARNWTGLGNTVLYGEYGRFDGGADGLLAGALELRNTELDFWGIGVVQHIDAAAMEVYVSYRNFSNSFIDDATGDVYRNDDLSIVMGGARVRF